MRRTWDINRAIELRQQGLTCREIGERLGQSYWSIWKALNRAGLTGGKGRSAGRRLWDTAKAIQMRESGMTYRAIAKELGMPWPTIATFFRNQRIKREL